jgi:hypothetical protein
MSKHVGFDDFMRSVEARLDKGVTDYGDQSFERSTGELLGEIREELEDVCGWVYVLWCRLQRLGRKANR